MELDRECNFQLGFTEKCIFIFTHSSIYENTFQLFCSTLCFIFVKKKIDFSRSFLLFVLTYSFSCQFYIFSRFIFVSRNENRFFSANVSEFLGGEKKISSIDRLSKQKLKRQFVVVFIWKHFLFVRCV